MSKSKDKRTNIRVHFSSNIMALFCSVLWCLTSLSAVVVQFPFSLLTDPLFTVQSAMKLSLPTTRLSLTRAKIKEASLLRSLRQWNHCLMAEEDPLPTMSYEADVFNMIQGSMQDRLSITVWAGHSSKSQVCWRGRTPFALLVFLVAYKASSIY